MGGSYFFRKIEKKKLDQRYITLRKSGESDSISGSRVHKIHDIQIHCMLGKKVRQRSKVYLLWILSQVQRKYMESWGEDTGERGVVLGAARFCAVGRWMGVI